MMQNTVKIFDTTLRDGEQSPGCSMNLEEKLLMGHQLAKLNVDIIEAGFPVASDGDFESVKTIAREVKGPSIAGLSRANKMDIDRCYEAVSHAEKPRIHTFIATSDIHMEHKLKMTRDQVLEAAVESVRYAAAKTPDVEFSAEDATRSDKDFLVKIFTEVISAGAKTINVPDTVGYAIPFEFGALIKYLHSNIPNIDQAVISVHCHNDLGLAVANSLEAIRNGARQAECTVNGIGERAGNASLEEIVMSLYVRKGEFNAETKIIKQQIYPSSKLLSSITGIKVQPNKAIVGENAFAHEAGIHQDGMIKHQLTYEIMTPESVGISKNKLVLGKHSGRNAFKEKLKTLGLKVEGVALEESFKAFKDLADKKKDVFDEDILVIVEGQRGANSEKYKLDSIYVTTGNQVVPEATVSIFIDGEKAKVKEQGDGPVDAVFKAIRNLTGFNGKLEKFAVQAITGGTDAQGEVVVTLSEESFTVRGSGAHTDTLTASALAYLSALNRLDAIRKKMRGV